MAHIVRAGGRLGRTCSGPAPAHPRRGLRRVAAAEVVGVRALLIHCENEAARDFYLRLAKFDAGPTDPMHFLLIKDLRQTITGV